MTTRRIWLAVAVVAVVAAATGGPLGGHRGQRTLLAQATSKKPAPAAAKKQAVFIVTDSSSDESDADTADTPDSSESDNADSSDNSDKETTPVVAGGDTRTIRIARQSRAVHDTALPMHVKVTFGVGTLGITPADAPWLYDVRLGYSPTRLTPLVQYDTAGHMLEIASKSSNITIAHKSVQDGADLRVMLGRGVPIRADIQFGAGQANLQFGGLSLRYLDLSTGASDATIGWDQPNETTLDVLRLQIGAAQFQARGLGNAHARRIVVAAGAGDVDLDFGGQWSSDAELEVTAALGAVHIHVPPGIALQTSSKAFVGSVDDNTGPSPGVPQVPGGPIYHLRLSATATLGSVEIDRHTAP